MREAFPRVHLESANRAEPLISQLTAQELTDCRAALSTEKSTQLLTIAGARFRTSIARTAQFTVIGLSADPDRVKSTSLMRNELDVVLGAAPSILAAAERSDNIARRLIHNLKTITAKTMQEVFAIAQQQELIGRTPQDQSAYIQSEILKYPEDAAAAFVEILKHQGAQKAEYSAFETLSGPVASTSRERHEVHKVLMNVFYLFFGDFVRNKVSAYVHPTRQTAYFDYDSMHACIYYIVENAAKYVKRGTRLSVTTESEPSETIIRFEMESTHIASSEEELIFQDGASGKLAREQHKNGSGIGLYLARQLAILNGGSLTVLCRRRPGDTLYSSNTFVLVLPKG